MSRPPPSELIVNNCAANRRLALPSNVSLFFCIYRSSCYCIKLLFHQSAFSSTLLVPSSSSSVCSATADLLFTLLLLLVLVVDNDEQSVMDVETCLWVDYRPNDDGDDKDPMAKRTRTRTVAPLETTTDRDDVGTTRQQPNDADDQQQQQQQKRRVTFEVASASSSS